MNRHYWVVLEYPKRFWGPYDTATEAYEDHLKLIRILKEERADCINKLVLMGVMTSREAKAYDDSLIYVRYLSYMPDSGVYVASRVIRSNVFFPGRKVDEQIYQNKF